MKESKRVSKDVMDGIEYTARTAGKISEKLEPFLDSAAIRNPELFAPLAVANTAISRASKLINSAREEQSGKRHTNSGKYQKMSVVEHPKINMIENAPYPPQYTGNQSLNMEWMNTRMPPN